MSFSVEEGAEEEVRGDTEIRSPCVIAPVCRRRAVTMECGQLLKAGKGTEMDSPQRASRKEHRCTDGLILAQ